MSLFVLDTDTFSLLLHGHDEVSRRIVQADAHVLALTIITVEESLTGWYSQVRRARRDDDILEAYGALHRTFDFLRDLPVLPFDASAIQRFRDLRRLHRRRSGNDLRIAAIVMEHVGILVTRNQQDF